MFEAEIVTLMSDRDSIPRIVHHTQHTPIHISWLHIHAFVHRSDKNVLCWPQLVHSKVNGPETPAKAGLPPRHVQATSIEISFHLSVFVFNIFDIRKAPRVALVKGYLNT